MKYSNYLIVIHAFFCSLVFGDAMVSPYSKLNHKLNIIVLSDGKPFPVLVDVSFKEPISIQFENEVETLINATVEKGTIPDYVRVKGSVEEEGRVVEIDYQAKTGERILIKHSIQSAVEIVVSKVIDL
ncbi:MAG: hypothetical protein HWE24_02235 [Oceanospirillaceae bacterium]|nr:hypothetical protein [Oceanospirillaceae bacterium]